MARKRPLTLFHFPALLAGIVTAVFLLTASVASYRLFVAASENAFVEQEIKKGTVTRYGAGVTYFDTNVPFDLRADNDEPLYDARREAFRREVQRSGLLAAPFESIRGPEVSLWPTGERDGELLRFGRLMFRSGFVDEVDVVERVEAPGVWISDYTATGMDVSAGDEIDIVFRGRSVEMRVRGVYEALHREAPTGYWRPWRSSIYPPCPGPPGATGCLPPPPFVLAEREELMSLSRELGISSATHGLDAPIAAATLTMDEARRLSAQFDSLLTRISSGTGGLRELFRCCGRIFPGVAGRGSSDSDLSSSIDQVVSVAERRVEGMRLPMTLLVVAASAVCMLALAGVGAYSLYARRTEMGFRAASGETPLEFAVRTTAEVIGPVVFGAATGFLTGAFLSTGLSGGALSPRDLLHAAWPSLVAVAIGAVLLATVATARFALLPLEERTARSTSISSGIVVVFVVATAVSAIALLTRLDDGGGGSGPPDPSVIAFPLLALIVLGAVAAVAIALGVSFTRRTMRLRRPALYVALARVAGASRLAFGLFAAALVCFGLFIAGQVIRTSLDETITAKTRLFVGSDVAATVDPGDQAPDAFSAPTTEVVRIHHAGLVGPTEVDLLGIDPRTFAKVAYWDERFGAPDLASLVARLGSGEGRVPAIVASGPLRESVTIQLPNEVLAIETVADVGAFPGMVSERPLVVMSTERLQRELDRQGSNLLETARTSAEWWVRGDPAEIRTALNGLEDTPYSITTARGVRNISYIATVLDSFAVLQILGAAAGALVVAALLTYLQARHRARLVSSILSRRMGLRQRAASLAVGLEVGILVGLPYLFAIPAAIGIAAVVTPTLDPLAVIPPEPLFEVPTATLVAGAVVVGVTLFLSSIWLARSADRANVSDVFRVAE